MLMLTSGDVQAWDHNDSVITPPDTDPNRRVDRIDVRLYISLSMIQLARDKLRIEAVWWNQGG